MPRTAIHSGEHLAEELVALEMSAAELARQLKVPTKRVTEILNGQRAITGDTALRLRSFVRHEPAVLAESSKPVRALVGRRKSGKAIKKLPTLKRLEEVNA